jgi:DNA-binding MarR family transcriptional regulator
MDSRGRDTDKDRVLRFMRLIWAIDHQLESVSKRMEASLGLTIPQRMTLLLIGRQPGILAGELAALLHMHPGTISGIIRRLEASEFIERHADPADARRVRLSLTEKGRDANRRRTGTFESAVRELLDAGAKADIDAAERVLAELAQRLQATAEQHASKQRGTAGRPSRAI